MVDYSQSKNLAKENPKKLAELKTLFDKEATQNRVYPIGASMYTVFFSPSEPKQRAHSSQVLPFGSASHTARFFNCPLHR